MTRKSGLCFVGLLLVLLGGAGRVGAAGVFIDAPGSVDAVYDSGRGLVYISTIRGDLLRYDLASRTFLPPLQLAARILGLDLSPDGTTLAAADPDFVVPPSETGTSWVYLVDLSSWTSRRIELERHSLESGTLAVAFVDDGTLVTTSATPSSVLGPMRRVDLTTDTVEEVASVYGVTMLSASADRSAIAYAEADSRIQGEFGVYDTATGSFREGRIDRRAYEAGANRDGSQFAFLASDGMHVFDADLVEIERVGEYGQSVPIGVAYHPTQDILYAAWNRTLDGIQALDARTLQPIGVVDDALSFGWLGGGAFGDGRLRISSDGEVLLALVDGGVKVYSPIDLVHEDRDGDGIENGRDNCPGAANPGQGDRDGNGVGDACNDFEDADGDDWADPFDNCPQRANPDQLDADLDGWGDACDNCPLTGNPEQTDDDPANGVGDVCEDSDGDGLVNLDEVDLHGSDPWNPDTDGDGLSDGDEVNVYGSGPLEVDTDGDGVDDGDEVNLFGTSPVDSDQVWSLSGTLDTRMGGRLERVAVTGRLLISTARTYVIQIDGEPAQERGVWFEYKGKLLLYQQNLLEMVRILERELEASEGEPVEISVSSIRSEGGWDERRGGFWLAADARCNARFGHSDTTESLSRTLRATGVTSAAAAAMARTGEDAASSPAGDLIAPALGDAPSAASVSVWYLAGTATARIGRAKDGGPISAVLTLYDDRTYSLGTSPDDPDPETGVWFREGNRLLLYQQDLLEHVVAFERFLAGEFEEPVELTLTRVGISASIKSRRGQAGVLLLKSDARFDMFFPRRGLTLSYSFSMKVDSGGGRLPPRRPLLGNPQ